MIVPNIPRLVVAAPRAIQLSSARAPARPGPYELVGIRSGGAVLASVPDAGGSTRTWFRKGDTSMNTNLAAKASGYEQQVKALETTRDTKTAISLAASIDPEGAQAYAQI